MKLIIDIDKTVYSLCKIASSNENAYVSALENAIKNGTPIQDGDLISRSELIEKLKSNFDDSDVYTEKDQFIIDCIHLLENEPTIGDTEKMKTCKGCAGDKDFGCEPCLNGEHSGDLISRSALLDTEMKKYKYILNGKIYFIILSEEEKLEFEDKYNVNLILQEA